MFRISTWIPAIYLALLVAACNGLDGFSESTTDFGDPYQIAVSVSPDAPDEPPTMSDDSLFVRVRYAGGCRDHDFHLNHRAYRDTIEVWFRHDANGDACEASIDENLSVALPRSVRRADIVLLRDPESVYSLQVIRDD